MHNIDISQMKNASGKWKTTSLIKGLRSEADYPPIFTLEDDDSGLPNMYRLYMAYDTEYTAAIKILGSYEHWLVLCASPQFKPIVEQWRNERNEREVSMAKEVILNRVREGDLRAATTIVAGNKGRKKAGRPNTKGEDEAAKKAAQVTSILSRVNK